MVPARFDNVLYYEDGMCNVQVDGKWGYLDKQGRMAIPARFDQARRALHDLRSEALRIPTLVRSLDGPYPIAKTCCCSFQ